MRAQKPPYVAHHPLANQIIVTEETHRQQAAGYRLNIPAGTAVRFEPGQKREVELVAFAGHRAVFGFRGEVMGPLEVNDE